MLTIRFDQLGLAPGDRVLDVGAGFGRHVFECARRGADVVALDYADDEVVQTRATFGGMVDAGEIDLERFVGVLRGDATKLPFANDSFDRGDHLRGARTHPGRRVGDRRDGPRAQARRPLRRNGADVVPREDQLDALRRVPRPEERGRPRPHLQRHRTEGQAPHRRPRPAGKPSAPTRCTRRTGG